MGEGLFSDNFYQACRHCLDEGCTLVAQNGTSSGSCATFSTRYYNPAIHIGAFDLPQYVLQAINKPSNE